MFILIKYTLSFFVMFIVVDYLKSEVND